MIMASRVSIKSPAAGLYHHSYDVSTVASLDFAELVPVRVIETVLKDKKFNVKGKGVLRVAPSDFPAYGKLYCKNASFFVPDHQLYYGAADFHTGSLMSKGKPVHRPWFSRIHMSYIFYQFHREGVGDDAPWCTTIHTTLTPQNDLPPANAGKWHFVHITDESGSASFHYMRLTSEGKRIYKLLKGLGFDWPSYPSYGVLPIPFSRSQNAANFEDDAVCLLAYAKIYTDYFLNTHEYNSSPLVAFLRAIRDGEDYSFSSELLFNSATGQIQPVGLDVLLKSFLLPYEHDYYTMAWNTPNSPLGVSVSSEMQSLQPEGPISPFLSLSDTSDPHVVYANQNQTFLQQLNYQSGNPTSLTYLTQLGLNWLDAIYKFIRLNKLFGSRPVDQLLARFGKKSDEYKSLYAHKLDEGSSRIDFSAVLSNTDSTNGDNGKPLGAYAGFAVGNLDVDFVYEPSDHGYIITVAWLQVIPMIVHGQHPHTMRRSFLDFWNPETDGKTIRPIPMAEISVNINSDDLEQGSNTDKKVFGFMNMGDDYRFMRDSILGDFVTDENVKNFVFARDFAVLRQQVANRFPLRAQSQRVQYYGRFGLESDVTDPFQFGEEIGDRFYLYIDWNIDADRPMLPRADSLNLYGSGDTKVELGGTQMS